MDGQKRQQPWADNGATKTRLFSDEETKSERVTRVGARKRDSRREKEKEKGRGREIQSEGEREKGCRREGGRREPRTDGREHGQRRERRGSRPTNLHYLREEAQLFHADRFRRGNSAGRVGNDVGFDRQQNCRTDDIGGKRHDCLSSAAELCTRALAP